MTAINTDLTKVIGDLSAGTPVASDLNTLLSAERTLLIDVGSTGGRTVSRDIGRLMTDVNGLNQQVNQVTQIINHSIADIQSTATRLTSTLASTASSTVSADLAALNTALTKVANDVSSGVSASADLKAAASALATLNTDVGATASRHVTPLLNGLVTT